MHVRTIYTVCMYVCIYTSDGIQQYGVILLFFYGDSNKSVFLKLFSVEEPLTELLISRGTPAYENKKNIYKDKLLAH